jgi:peptidoglycan/xylan/chitin deacetylase (PgdA/CDA1 family)
MRYAAARVLHGSGLARLGRALLARKGRFVLMLHDVFGERRPELPTACQRGLTTAEAAELLGWLRREVRLLTPEAFLHSDEPGVLLTVDDGKANNATFLLPLLERFEAPALFFVPTQHVRDPRNWLADARQAAGAHWADPSAVPAELAAELYDGLSPDQVRACDRHPLVTIGAHSESHPRLSECDDDRLAAELAESKAYLEDLLGHPVPLLAYPYGDYDGRVARAAEHAGYSHAFAVEPRGIGRTRFEIPRLHVERPAPYYLAAKLSGLFRRPMAGRP